MKASVFVRLYHFFNLVDAVSLLFWLLYSIPSSLKISFVNHSHIWSIILIRSSVPFCWILFSCHFLVAFQSIVFFSFSNSFMFTARVSWSSEMFWYYYLWDLHLWGNIFLVFLLRRNRLAKNELIIQYHEITFSFVSCHLLFSIGDV